MSNSRPSSNKSFFALAGLVLVASAAGLASLAPAAFAYARSQSPSLVVAAKSANGDEAYADWRLAYWLDPSSDEAAAGLASAQLAVGQTEAAQRTLRQAGQGTNVLRIRCRVELESGQRPQAATCAGQLAGRSHSEADTVMAGLVEAGGGDYAGAGALKAAVSSPEALQTLSRAQAGQVPLAQELYAHGLPVASGALLRSLPTSASRNLLLGQIDLDRGDASAITEARDYLSEAVRLDPASVPAHQCYAKVLRKLGQSNQANDQDALATKLQSGRL